MSSQDFIERSGNRASLGGADPETGLKVVALRSDLTPEQRAEALRIGRFGFASAGPKRKPKKAIAAKKPIAA
jgi:hypothetical protein